MRKRFERDYIFLENEDGQPLLSTHVDGGVSTLECGEWKMVRDASIRPEEILSRVPSHEILSHTFRFYEVTIQIRSAIPYIINDFRGMYRNFFDKSSEPDLIIDAVHSIEEEYSWIMVMQPTDGRDLKLKGDFSSVTLFTRLDHLLAQIYIEAETFVITNNKQHMFIHGGAVVKDGAGYIMPAQSNCGKTTLTLALTAAGYGFMSDEFAVLNSSTGQLLPFPRNLSLREDSLKLFPELSLDANDLPIICSPRETLYSLDPMQIFNQNPKDQCPVRFVLFPNYNPRQNPSINPISRMEAVKRLIGNQNYISLGTSDKQSALDLLLSVLAQAQCFELSTGDLPETIRLVNKLKVL